MKTIAIALLGLLLVINSSQSRAQDQSVVIDADQLAKIAYCTGVFPAMIGEQQQFFNKVSSEAPRWRQSVQQTIRDLQLKQARFTTYVIARTISSSAALTVSLVATEAGRTDAAQCLNWLSAADKCIFGGQPLETCQSGRPPACAPMSICNQRQLPY